jgi:hypothetical protein
MTTHPAARDAESLLADCSIQRTRRSGPGGQRRNKVETAVVLTHRPTGLRVEASERRSQAENLSRAVFRLRLQLAVHVRTGALDVPSELWSRRVAGRRIAVDPSHAEFPGLLAEALDALARCEWSAAEAAQLLGVSSSQLVKLVRLEPQALAVVNAQRQQRGLPPYK